MDKVAIIDDSLFHLKALVDMLKDIYEVYPLRSGAELFSFLEYHSPEIILVNVFMKELDGISILKRLRKKPSWRQIPVIFLTEDDQENKAIECLKLGAVDFLRKPFNYDLVRYRVGMHLELAQHRKGLNDSLEEKTKMLVSLQQAVINSCFDLLECRDGYTGGHTARTAAYVKILAESLVEQEIYAEEICDLGIDNIVQAVLLHDIGKIGIKDATLLKPASLDYDEFEYMKQHTVLGYHTILKAAMVVGDDLPILEVAMDVTCYHHEKWNGEGYPKGLSGEDIPLAARIAAIVDVYDALTTKRPYKRTFTHKEAVELIASESGTHFDPALVQGFMQCAKDFEKCKIDKAYDSNDYISTGGSESAY